MVNKYFSICVIGASNVDINIRVREKLHNDTSVVGKIYLTSGGGWEKYC